MVARPVLVTAPVLALRTSLLLCPVQRDLVLPFRRPALFSPRLALPTLLLAMFSRHRPTLSTFGQHPVTASQLGVKSTNPHLNQTTRHPHTPCLVTANQHTPPSPPAPRTPTRQDSLHNPHRHREPRPGNQNSDSDQDVPCPNACLTIPSPRPHQESSPSPSPSPSPHRPPHTPQQDPHKLSTWSGAPTPWHRLHVFLSRRHMPGPGRRCMCSRACSYWER